MPATDAGVAVQFGLMTLAGLIGWVRTRKHPNLRRLIVGSTTLLVALMAARAVH